MSAGEYVAIALFFVSLLFSIIGYLINARVSRLDRDNETLNERLTKAMEDCKHEHEKDAAELVTMKIKMAESYSSKTEIKGMFDEFKSYLDERFNNIEQIARYSGTQNGQHSKRDNNGN